MNEIIKDCLIAVVGLAIGFIVARVVYKDYKPEPAQNETENTN